MQDWTGIDALVSKHKGWARLEECLSICEQRGLLNAISFGADLDQMIVYQPTRLVEEHTS